MAKERHVPKKYLLRHSIWKTYGTDNPKHWPDSSECIKHPESNLLSLSSLFSKAAAGIQRNNSGEKLIISKYLALDILNKVNDHEMKKLNILHLKIYTAINNYKNDNFLNILTISKSVLEQDSTLLSLPKEIQYKIFNYINFKIDRDISNQLKICYSDQANNSQDYSKEAARFSEEITDLIESKNGTDHNNHESTNYQDTRETSLLALDSLVSLEIIGFKLVDYVIVKYFKITIAIDSVWCASKVVFRY